MIEVFAKKITAYSFYKKVSQQMFEKVLDILLVKEEGLIQLIASFIISTTS